MALDLTACKALAALRVGSLIWLPVADADPRALALYRRHYSRRHYRDHRVVRRFVGPGEYSAFLTAGCDALWVWRKFTDPSGQAGVNNAVFRREDGCSHRASDLIREAVALAWARWPGERLYTYVNPKHASANPGYCYKLAGWRFAGLTQGGLHILAIEVSRD